MNLLHRHTLLAVLLSSFAVGCASGPKVRADVVGYGALLEDISETKNMPNAEDLPMLSGEASDDYRIGPMDQLTVVVWGRPDLGSQIPTETGERRITTVAADGTLSLPFLDNLPIAGKTTAEVSTMIEAAYANVVEAPQIEVEMAQFRSRVVFLEGAVARPGQVYLSDTQRTVGEVLTAAGGLDPLADTAHGVLARDGQEYQLDYLAVERGESPGVLNVMLQEGDKIHFPSINERVVYIFGEVRRQGAFPIPNDGLTVLDALGMAGGYQQVSANMEGLYLMRRAEQGTTIYKLSLAQLLEGPEVSLTPGDRIYLSPSGLAVWQRTWTQMLPFFSAGGNTASAALAIP